MAGEILGTPEEWWAPVSICIYSMKFQGQGGCYMIKGLDLEVGQQRENIIRQLGRATHVVYVHTERWLRPNSRELSATI